VSYEDVVPQAITEVGHEWQREEGHSFDFPNLLTTGKQKKPALLVKLKLLPWNEDSLVVFIGRLLRHTLILLLIVIIRSLIIVILVAEASSREGSA
jgi:hypothetical protein